MSRRRKAGITRRPAEYVLVLTAILLIAALLWSLYVIRQETSKSYVTKPQSVDEVPRYDDIQFVAEKNFTDENTLDHRYDEWLKGSSTALDGAADNISGVYDESAY